MAIFFAYFPALPNNKKTRSERLTVSIWLLSPSHFRLRWTPFENQISVRLLLLYWKKNTRIMRIPFTNIYIIHKNMYFEKWSLFSIIKFTANRYLSMHCWSSRLTNLLLKNNDYFPLFSAVVFHLPSDYCSQQQDIEE